LRAGDVISICNNKIFILLHGMNFGSSGIILERFNNFCKKFDLDQKPSLDIKEIK
jgi:hypothetical protein